MTANAAETEVDRRRRWEQRLIGRTKKLLREGSAELDLESGLTAGDRRIVEASAALSRLTAAAVARLDESGSAGGAEGQRLSSLALRAIELQDDVRLCLRKDRERRYKDMQRGLDRLRRVGTSAGLVDRVCREVVESCGFSRAVLTRVEDGAWLPWMAYMPGDSDLEERFVDWMNRQRFSAAALGRDLGRLRPVLVDDAEGHAGTFKPMIEFSGTSSYVAAPVAPTGRLVGVLYADYSDAGQTPDELDRDVLWTFAEDFGRTYERLVLIERMRIQRKHVREAFEFAEGMMGSLAGAEIELARGTEERLPAENGHSMEAPKAAAIIDGLLTPREAEVLEMMVRGASNVVIADRLAIKGGTVKSHVKHILRKLDAVNRAEAIARYMGHVRD
jgi:DNA-binding CsgD family transcriptional regulator